MFGALVAAAFLLSAPAAAQSPFEQACIEDIEAAIDRCGVEVDPKIRFAEDDHWLFDIPGKARPLARAARDSDGGEWIYINLGEMPSVSVEDRIGWLSHEVAHLFTWRGHGEGVAEHGPEFRSVCRAIVPERQSYFCRGE